MSGPPQDAGLNDLADALRRLAPAGALDRDAVLFRAGQAAAPRSRFWPPLALVGTTASAVLAVVLLTRPTPEPRVERVFVPVERAPAPSPAAPAEQHEMASTTDDPTPARRPAHLRLQDRLLRFGLTGLARPTPEPGAPPTRRPGVHSSSLDSIGVSP